MVNPLLLLQSYRDKLSYHSFHHKTIKQPGHQNGQKMAYFVPQTDFLLAGLATTLGLS